MLRRLHFLTRGMNYSGSEIYAYQWNTELLKKIGQDFMKMKTSQTQVFFCSFGFFSA